jgi:hypothetical protein
MSGTPRSRITDTQPPRLRRLQDAAGQDRRKGPGMSPNPGTEELLELLAAILDTLTVEPRATSGEEDLSQRAQAALEYRKLLEHRALLVRVALENLQRNLDAESVARTAAWLRQQAAMDQ